MSAIDLNQIFESLAWLITLISVIMGLYVLVLNPRHTANRNVGALLLVVALHTYATGVLTGAKTLGEASLPSIILSMTLFALRPMLLLASFALLATNLLKERWRWLLWIPRVLAILPAILTLVDVWLGTSLWFTGLNPETYTGGYEDINAFIQGGLAIPILLINGLLVGLATLALLVFVASFDKQANRSNKQLAWILLIANLVTLVATLFLRNAFLPPLPVLLVNAFSVAAYSYPIFQQTMSESRERGGSLHMRLTVVTLTIALPLLAATAIFLSSRAQSQFEESAVERLGQENQALSTNVSYWLDYNVRALQALSRDPRIMSMDAVQQKPMLQSMTVTYPYMYLVSTTDMTGMNIARSDDAAMKDYSDRVWYKEASSGVLVTYQTLKGRTSGQPALVVSVPIYGRAGAVVGVAMFACDLDEVVSQVHAARVGQEGYAFIIDQINQVVAHPDEALTAELTSLSNYPPVVNLRQGKNDLTVFTDEDGKRWRANINLLPNGWGIITQQPEAEFLSSIRGFQRLGFLVLLLAAGMLYALTRTVIRQSLQPVVRLTETASAIASGDLSRVAPVESEDELGMLASAFNDMTEQLRGLIGSLEDRVNERTQDLERRAVQLQVTANVAREAASILDLEGLLKNVVRLISDRFGFYHAGIFLLGESRSDDASSGMADFAVLRAASSEGGQNMLARGHRLKVGQVGIVGYVAATGQPRIALDVGKDAVFFNNPDLPLTRSEMALPLRIQQRVIGVLDVQSTQQGAFTQEDVDTLQVLADQVALAIENARLLSAAEISNRQLEAALGRQTRQSWERRLGKQPVAYTLDPTGVRPVMAEEAGQSPWSAASAVSSAETFDGYSIDVPIELRGERLGSLMLRRPKELGPWTPQEKELIDASITQAALALENARLLDEIQNRARQEELINQIVSRAQASLSMETVMKTAVQEIGRAINVSKVQIRLKEETE